MLNYPQARVLNDYVLVRPLAPEQFSSGGILKPEDAQDRPNLGIVLAVGPGPRHAITSEPIPMTLEVGDLVTFNKFAGVEVDAAQNVWLMRETELGVSFAPAQFELITHEDPRTWHLAGSYCEACAKRDESIRAAVEKVEFGKLQQRIREQAGHLGEPINVRVGEDPSGPPKITGIVG